jgi:hypothetical protein
VGGCAVAVGVASSIVIVGSAVWSTVVVFEQAETSVTKRRRAVMGDAAFWYLLWFFIVTFSIPEDWEPLVDARRLFATRIWRLLGDLDRYRAVSALKSCAGDYTSTWACPNICKRTTKTQHLGPLSMQR